MRRPWKASRKLSRIDRYEHVERSMRVFISTVMNMWNDRYETTCRWVSPDLSMGFARFIAGFRPIYQWVPSDLSMVLPNIDNGFARFFA